MPSKRELAEIERRRWGAMLDAGILLGIVVFVAAGVWAILPWLAAVLP